MLMIPVESNSIELTLTTGRTLKQGIAMEHGKLGAAYEDEAGAVELDATDVEQLKVSAGTILHIKSR
ncbi:MAG: hypothetical protein ACTSVM_02575, partial [Candidatus Ranarchaeia archaeon]